jgi:hypothetical protein
MISIDEQVGLMRARVAGSLDQTPRLREALQRNASIASLGAILVQSAACGPTEHCALWSKFLSALDLADLVACVARPERHDAFVLGPMSRLAFVAAITHANRANLEDSGSGDHTLTVENCRVVLGPQLRTVAAILARLSALKGAPDRLTIEDLNRWLAHVDLSVLAEDAESVAVCPDHLFDAEPLFFALEAAFAGGEWNEDALKAVARASAKESL